MKRIVYREERRATTRRHPVFDFQRDDDHATTEPTDDLLTVDDLVNTGKLSEDDYLDIMQSLEEALREESREESVDELLLAEQMVDFEEASLMAMLNGLDLDGVADFDQHDVADESGLHVLCPMCKTGSLECATRSGSSTLFCKCGFTFVLKDVLPWRAGRLSRENRRRLPFPPRILCSRAMFRQDRGRERWRSRGHGRIAAFVCDVRPRKLCVREPSITRDRFKARAKQGRNIYSA
ncbi:hypothetical protein PINS_up009512 [Pythium insidiosum]|nr:hypothetical protein PINS_up009512 [Pythium insidiosum]